jgi:ribosomal peptide maturation radical SAM protein 1
MAGRSRQRGELVEQSQAVFISMPWTALSEPSLGLGILKAQLARQGVRSRILHLNLGLLRYLKASTYFGLGEAFGLNDFVFTCDFEPTLSPEQERALELRVEELLANGAGIWLGHNSKRTLLDLVLSVRNAAIPKFLDDCLCKVSEAGGTMVGFSCLFDQTIASVALAKRVKEAFPEKLIVLGGYALEGPVGHQIMASFPWIDAVAFGDGEEVIAGLVQASMNRSVLADLPGIVYRPEPDATPVTSPLPPRRVYLDHSPAPDYDDYRADVEELQRVDRVTVKWDTLPIESSRGCWWGQTKHCVFCGIDDATMKYRLKSPEVVLEQMSSLERRFGLNQFRFSDYILPHSYFDTLLPKLAAGPVRYVLSCEMKANIDERRFQLMRDAGFVEVQPGIESFSTPVLRQMDKGVTAIQNAYTLILGYRLDIEVHYNFLFGFPLDRVEDYQELLRTVPLLYHLTPPISRSEVVTTRFAPMQVNPTRFGVTRPIEHDPRYEVIFSEAYLEKHGFDYDNYCYYFQQPYENSDELRVLYALLRHQIQYWKDIHRNRAVQLSYETHNGRLRILDSRYSDQPRETLLGAAHTAVYLACTDDITSLRHVRAVIPDTLPDQELERVLEDLVSARLIMRDGNSYLGLAIPAAVYTERPARTKSAKWVSPYV